MIEALVVIGAVTLALTTFVGLLWFCRALTRTVTDVARETRTANETLLAALLAVRPPADEDRRRTGYLLQHLMQPDKPRRPHPSAASTPGGGVNKGAPGVTFRQGGSGAPTGEPGVPTGELGVPNE